MPTYILLSSLTPEGRHTVHKNPERVAGVNDEIEKFGCKVISQYATLGVYDFVTVIEGQTTKLRPTYRLTSAHAAP